MPFYIGIESDCSDQGQLHDKMYNLPKIGTHYGSGRHVPMPETWQGATSSPGWSSYQGSTRRHPTLTQFAIAIIADGDRGQLSAAELLRLDTRKAAAVATLPADWDPPPLGGGGGGGTRGDNAPTNR